jgi:hypothetical protein
MNLALHFDFLPTFGARPPLFHLSPYIFTSSLPYLSFDRHRDEKPVTASPLDSAFTKRDARNSFRIRSCENCRVPPIPRIKNLKSYLRFDFANQALCSPLSLFVQRAKRYFFNLNGFRALSRNRRVYWVSSCSGTRHSSLHSSSFDSYSSKLFCTYKKRNSFLFRTFRTLL